MAEADWTDLTNSLAGGVLARGVTAGEPPPPGGGTHVYGMRTLSVVTGAFGKFTNQTNFAPTAAFKDHSVRGALKKGISAGAPGFSPFLFAVLQGPDVADSAYLLGLSDGDPGYISLVKGRITDGIPDAAPGALGVLRRSTQTVPIGTWVHLRLDAVINTNGDVVLNVFRNDLSVNTVASPVWAAVPGINQFIDDALGANSGSIPFTEGRMGFAGRFADVGRRVYFDRLECIRET
jgi:hypothetical protein